MTDLVIEKKDIEKLATLSRMKLSDEEKDRFVKEIGSILGYVKQIQEVADELSSDRKIDMTPDHYPHRNALREDVDNRDIIDDTSVLVGLAPASEDGYVKVKKILG